MGFVGIPSKKVLTRRGRVGKISDNFWYDFIHINVGCHAGYGIQSMPTTI